VTSASYPYPFISEAELAVLIFFVQTVLPLLIFVYKKHSLLSVRPGNFISLLFFL
jgi:hypothetical protein